MCVVHQTWNILLCNHKQSLSVSDSTGLFLKVDENFL